MIRDPIDLLRATFLIGAIVAALLGDTATAVRLALTFVVVVVARLLDLPRPFDLLVVIGMLLQGWGNAFDLFKNLGWYDAVVHVVLTFATAPAVYVLLVRLDAVPDLVSETHRHNRLGIVIVTLAIGLALGALYELYEWLANNAFGAKLRTGYADTIADLAEDALAAPAGGILLVAWAAAGWGTTRRLPRTGS